MTVIQALPIRVISKNIRYATEHPFPGEVLWLHRRGALINELKFNSLYNKETLICCQEVLHHQLQDILEGLQELGHWDYIGWGRDDGDQAGEYSPIFFRPNTWQKLESNPIWLSKTPGEKGSRYPGAGSVRILTRAKFKHIESGAVIVIYCTHLDDASSEARKYAAELICKLTVEDSKFPLILAGDFNSEINQEAYQCLTLSGLFQDVMNLENSIIYGNSHTFTGFGSKDERQTRIDYIFCHRVHEPPPADKTVFFSSLSYAVLSNRFDDGVYNSDHRAVVADLVLASSLKPHVDLQPQCKGFR